jgi:type I restriction enzyme S subunit|nr:nucleotidyltransferase domain-containing protein [uncultured Flavobacterium sp.]
MMGTIGLNDTDIEKIRAVFSLHKELEKVVLYGSRAKGTYKPASDIDLVLVGDDLNLTIQQAIENELDDLLLPYKFDVSLFHQIENMELVNHIERVGKVFFVNN